MKLASKRNIDYIHYSWNKLRQSELNKNYVTRLTISIIKRT